LRLGLFIGGALIAVMGIAWALQGAWILPATFMRGPEWIAIGGALAAAGFVLIFFSMRTKAPEPAPPKPSP
jgi:hypothetical protein